MRADIKRVGLIVHGGREDTPHYARKAVELLAREGVTVCLEADAPETIAHGTDNVAPLYADTSIDLFLSLGGDGTLLRSVQLAAERETPVLGVNLGHVGFLTEVGPENMEQALQSVLHGEYTVDERTLLRAARQSTGESFLALNDVVVSRGGYARLIMLDVLAGGELTGHYVADGLIVATPTGSTGYSLSAGGPILHPSVDCMVITPICAHSLQHRPVVVPGNETIALTLGSEDEGGAMLQIDGRTCGELRGGETIVIGKDEKKARLVRFGETKFFRTVREKLTEWSR